MNQILTGTNILLLAIALSACLERPKANREISRQPRARTSEADAMPQATEPVSPAGSSDRSAAGTGSTETKSPTLEKGSGKPENSRGSEQTTSQAETNGTAVTSKPLDSPNTDETTLRTVRTMALLGDSIGVGFLADTRLGDPLPNNSAIKDALVQTQLQNQSFDEALGVAAEEYRNHHQSAFVSPDDTDCFAHSCKLKLATGNSANLAQIGARIQDLVLSQSRLLKGIEDYVVVEIGANDLCADDFDRASFLADYQTLAKKLAALPSQPVVLFIPIPNIAAVFDAAPADTASSYFQIIFAPIQFSCGQIRDGGLFGDETSFCPRYSDSSLPAALEREHADINTAIKAIVEGGPDNFVFAQELLDWLPDQEDLAADCFHPNMSALKRLAEDSMRSVIGKLEMP